MSVLRLENRLRTFLDENDVRYLRIDHSPAYTAQEIAALTHISGKELAKTVMVKVDGELAMAVLPASDYVDFDALSVAAGSADVDLAEEDEFQARFPDCELGAMPPFGNLYEMKVFLSPALAEDEEITFNAGSHTELIKMKYSDYERMVGASIVRLPDSVRT